VRTPPNDSLKGHVLMVGAKLDRIDERQVPRDTAELLARRFGCGYIETSARDRTNLEQSFVMCYELYRSGHIIDKYAFSFSFSFSFLSI
jgi:hypothetical protein